MPCENYEELQIHMFNEHANDNSTLSSSQELQMAIELSQKLMRDISQQPQSQPQQPQQQQPQQSQSQAQPQQPQQQQPQQSQSQAQPQQESN
jgi:hypothetical protein